jgi:CubicO group peptidase (beta-lactamase class C family)
LAVSVFDGAHTVAECALGAAAVDRPGDAMTTRTLFRLISLTKMLTTLAALRLVDAGRLALDEPVAGLFPRSARLAGPITAVTLRQLLSHTSGLVRGTLNPDVGGRDADGLAEYTLSAGISAPFIASPGTVYSYSDQAFSLVGYFIERVTGSYFEAAMRQLVFEPLALASACFDPLAAMTCPLSQQHVPGRNGRIVRMRRFADSARFRPYGGAFCSVHELARFGMLHLGDGLAPGSGDRLISARALREIRTPHADIGLDIGLSYGLGAYLGPSYGGHLAYGHEGYPEGTWAKLVLVPGLRFGLAWCDNRGPDADLIAARYQAIEAIVAELRQAAPGWPARDHGPDARPDARCCTGRYRRLTGRPIEVSAADGSLVVTDGGARIPLMHHHGSVFAAADPGSVPDRLPWQPHAGSARCCVRFVVRGDGPASHLTLNGLAYRRADAPA